MTVEEIRERFHVHTDQIPKLVGVKAFWALAHYLVIFPDICAALESSDGKTDGARYISWAKQYLEDAALSGEEYYDIRCKLLHEGNTLGRHKYANYAFTEPDSRDNVIHKCVFSGDVIVIDVNEFSKEVLTALENWFTDIAENRDPIRSANVIKNLPHLVQVFDIQDASKGAIVGLNNPISASR